MFVVHFLPGVPQAPTLVPLLFSLFIPTQKKGNKDKNYSEYIVPTCSKDVDM
jgi:hypothetical protein